MYLYVSVDNYAFTDEYIDDVITMVIVRYMMKECLHFHLI